MAFSRPIGIPATRTPFCMRQLGILLIAVFVSSCFSFGGDIDNSKDDSDVPHAPDDETDRGQSEVDTPCRLEDRRYPINAQLDFTSDAGVSTADEHDGGIPVVTCAMRPQNELSMTYEMPLGHWGLCTFSTGVDFHQFDERYGNGGVIEVRFCLSQASGGELRVNLWYGTFPFRRHVVLVDEEAPAGCFTKRFEPQDAVLPEPQQGDVQEDISYLKNSSATLGVEWSRDRVAGSIQIVWTKYFPPECICLEDSDCADPTAHRCNVEPEKPLFHPRCEEIHDCLNYCDARYPDELSGCLNHCHHCGGVCTEQIIGDCDGEVGRFSSGLHPSISDGFREKHRAYFPLLGCPGCGGGCDKFTREKEEIIFQEFFQDTPGLRLPGALSGQSAILFNREHSKAYVLYDLAWRAYRCLEDPETPNAQMAGATLLGSPTIDPWETDTGWRQDFDRGTVSWDRLEGRLTVYLSQGNGQGTPHVASDCDTLENAILFIDGNNPDGRITPPPP